jgi:tetratricopeptide (TPR) repeat protein
VIAYRSVDSSSMSKDIYNFLAKQREFKKKFNELFFEKLQSFQDISIGKAEAKVEYGITGSAMKFIVENVISNAAGGIPFVGPFAAGFLSTLPTQLHEYYEKKRLTGDATEVTVKLYEVGAARIERVIDELAHEISIIFEYQIAVLKDMPTVAKAAKAAVDKIFEADQNARFNFDMHGLLSALVVKLKPNAVTNFANKLAGNVIMLDTLLSDGTVSWKSGDVFTNVGVREVGYEQSYRFKATALDKTLPVCGFRGMIMDWNESKNEFYPSHLDGHYTRVLNYDKSNVAMAYVPFHRLVQQFEIDAYLQQLPSERSFVRFFATLHHCSATDIRPVFRNVSFDASHDLVGCDFSLTDMSRIILKDRNCGDGVYEQTRLVASQIVSTNLANSMLRGCDLRWSEFTDAVLAGETDLTQANMKYAILGSGTDLTDNLSLGQATNFSDCIIVTTKMAKLFVQKVKVIEMRNEELERKLILLEAKDAEREEKMKLFALQMEAFAKSNPDAYIFYNVLDPKDDFSGRDQVMDDIQSYFQQASSNQSLAGLVVAADGGMGKTEVILEVVKRMKYSYGPENLERVYWIEAETKQTIASSFKQLANCMKIVTENRSDVQIRKDVLIKLKMKMENRPMLLIYDNVDQFKTIKDYLPDKSSKHHVIITTRRTDNWPEYLKVYPLPPFTEEETLDYVQSHLEDASDEDIKKLAVVLSYRPLELSMAVSYIQKYDVSIMEYIDYYSRSQSTTTATEQRQEIIRVKSQRVANIIASSIDDDDDNSSKTALSPVIPISQDSLSEYENVSRTVSITLEGFDGQYAIATEVMKICGYLHADSIPVRTFSSLFESDRELLKIVILLEENKLIKVKLENGERFLFIHRLVQNVMRDKVLQSSDEQRVMMLVSDLVHQQMAEVDDNIDIKEIKSKNTLMLHHAISVIQHYINVSATIDQDSKYVLTLSVTRLHLDLGRLYCINASHEESLKYLLAMLSILEPIDGKHFLVSLAHYWIAWVYRDQGKYNDANIEVNKALVIQEGLFGHNHPTVANSVNDIASCAYYLGRYDESLEKLKEAAKIRETYHGRYHFAVAQILNNIGTVMVTRGHYDEGIVLMEEALQIRRKLLSPDHPDIALTMNNLGTAYCDQGKYQEAYEKYDAALKLREACYGHNHPEVANSIKCIASLFFIQGKYVEAKEKYYEALGIYEATYGRQHPDIAGVLYSIAGIVAREGHFQEALEKNRDALAIREAIFGHDHPDVGASVASVADIYFCQGMYTEALERYQESKRIYEKVFGGDHSDVADSLNRLGAIYQEQAQYEAAMTNFKEALRIFETIYGHNHTRVADTLNGIGMLHYVQQQYADALTFLNDALIIRESFYGHNHTDVASTYTNIANVYSDEGRYEEAEEKCKEALKINESIFGSQAFAVASGLVSLGAIYSRRGDNEQALQAFEDARRIQLETYAGDVNHPDIKNIDNWIEATRLQANGETIQGIETPAIADTNSGTIPNNAVVPMVASTATTSVAATTVLTENKGCGCTVA